MSRARLRALVCAIRREWGGFQCAIGVHEVIFTEGAPGGCARCQLWDFRRPSELIRWVIA